MPGLPDLSWHNIPKCGQSNIWPQQMHTCIPIGIKGIKIFYSKAFQNITKSEVLVWRYVYRLATLAQALYIHSG
jgi:hypothetical protein